MRSHVMKGKNAGKKLHRSSKLDLVKSSSSENKIFKQIRNPNEENEPESVTQQKLLFPTATVRDLGNVFCTVSFPVKLRPYSLEVINQCKHSD
jgi:hypothetical protein